LPRRWEAAWCHGSLPLWNNKNSPLPGFLKSAQAAPVDLDYQKEAHQGSVSSTCRRDCKEAAQVGWVSEDSVTA
jgi:hypothetical protein